MGKELARIRTGEEEPAPEALREAIRDVITHCLYGVDKNPLAVELCKVALWIEGHTRGKPLTFLDHRIKCGDSLVGVFDLSVLEKGIPEEAYEPVEGDDRDFARKLKNELRRVRREQEAGHYPLFNPAELVRKLAGKLEDIARLPENTAEEVHKKSALYHELLRNPELEKLRLACDFWTAAFFARLRPEDSQHIPLPLDLQNILEKGKSGVRGDLLGAVEAMAHRMRFFHWPLEFPEVFAQGGFDVVLGNPPFMGGLKISGTLGNKYRHWLEVVYAPFKGTADLCAAFYRRAFSLLKPGGRMGMVATNTISQGDTRESGLAHIVRSGGVITFAQRFIKWPGVANVEVNLVAIHKPDHSPSAIHHSPVLDGHPVPFISSRLDPDPEAEPKRLPQNEGKAFIGDYVLGLGFLLEPEEAEALLARDPRNRDCLFPYLNGEDLNSHPEQKPSRWVICFHDWPLERAKQYPDLLWIVEQRVKPQRSSLPPTNATNRKRRDLWWQFAVYAQHMRQAIALLRRVLVRALTSEFHMMAFVPNHYIYSHALGVFAFDDDYHFALLQSSVHEVWVWRQASSLESRNRYTPTDCFDTFSFPPEEYRRIAKGEWRMDELPQPFRRAAQIGAEYHEHRRQIMLARNIGLTQTYNLFHNPSCSDPDIERLRALHAEMDNAILACYGWDDLSLDHGFYQNDRGQVRFTISPEARRELLFRLIELNAHLSKTAGS